MATYQFRQIRAQERAGHGIQVVSFITKRTRKQVGILFVGDTDLWEGLGEDGDKLAVLNGQGAEKH